MAVEPDPDFDVKLLDPGLGQISNLKLNLINYSAIYLYNFSIFLTMNL